MDNRFLEGSANVGTFKKPGLPNIKGAVSVRGNTLVGEWSEGAFYITRSSTTNMTEGTNSLYTTILNFDASRSSSIYGESSTVQPKSYTVLYIMKIK